jgi:hypothetical protein
MCLIYQKETQNLEVVRRICMMFTALMHGKAVLTLSAVSLLPHFPSCTARN